MIKFFNSRAFLSVILTLILGVFVAASAQQLSPEAGEALRKGQAAAARALNSYVSHNIDQPLWREAISYGQTAQRLAPERPEPLRFLGQVYSLTGWYIRAYQSYEAYQKLVGNLDAQAKIQFAEASRKLGYASYSSGNAQAALDYYTKAYELQPDNMEVVVWLGRLYFEQGNPTAALPFWREAVEREPENEGYQYYLEQVRYQARYGVAASNAYFRGLAAYEEGRKDEALAAFREAVEANTDYLDAFVWAGRTSLELGQPGLAATYWQRVLSLDPTDERAAFFYNLAQDQARWGVAAVNAFREGLTQYEANNRTAALASFARATSFNAGYAEAWAWRGRLELEQQNYQAAAEFFGNAVNLDPGNAAYRSNLREAQLNLQRLAEQAAASVAVVEPTAEPQAENVAEISDENDETATAPAETTLAAVEADTGVIAVATEELATIPTPSPPDEAEVTAGGGQIVLLDVTVTHEGDFESGKRAFASFGLPSDLPSNMSAPVNYATGTLYQRVEVLNKPSYLTVQYQLCFLQGEDSPTKQACSDKAGLKFAQSGVYEYSQPMYLLDRYTAVDWRRSLSSLQLVLNDNFGVPVDNRFGYSGKWYGSPIFDLYYPIVIRYKAVLVPPGESFAGWP